MAATFTNRRSLRLNLNVAADRSPAQQDATDLQRSQQRTLDSLIFGYSPCFSGLTGLSFRQEVRRQSHGLNEESRERKAARSDHSSSS